jgi:positive regulator of sigma E activity
MPENIIGIVSMLAVVFCVVAGAITAFMMLNDLSKKRTPFTLRISCLMRNLGIYLIILDIAKAIFIYIAAGEVIVGLFWFAGIIFYAFSLVFRYGKNLQKESDETL